MTYYSENINTLWGALIIEELVRSGVSYFCISPGSRSTPLTVAAASNNKASTIICYDERAAAFHALGYARATGKPACLICTSGTAVANYYPAVVEASTDFVPMIILSADRPPELRDTRANQTIHQPNIYGQYVRWFFDMPCPDEKISPNMVLTTIDQAVYQSNRSPQGPVHINCMFREPLAPSLEPPPNNYVKDLESWTNDQKPYTSYSPSTLQVNKDSLQEVADLIRTTRRGLLVLGRMDSVSDRKAAEQFAQHLGWPVCADITSGHRIKACGENVISYMDQVLLSEKCRHMMKPETIVHVGGQVTSKRFWQFLEETEFENYIVLNNQPYRQDSIHKVTHRVEIDASFLWENRHFFHSDFDGKWVRKLKFKSNIVSGVLNGFMKNEHNLNEIAVARLISTYTPQNFGLFLASSMPIRDFDMYADPNGAVSHVASNRGASGIDGTITSAAGYAVGLNKPVTLVIGDLAFLHDLNSLALLNSIDQPLIVVVINNQGGGIFSFLPISQFSSVFEPFFATPHSFEFEHAAKLFHIPYYQPTTNNEFIELYQSLSAQPVTTIIEIKTDRQENKNIHQRLQTEIKSVLDVE